MELIADILLVAGALGAGLYCFVLSRRLKRFTDLEKGVGGAVAVLSSQAEELKKSLDSARDASDQSGATLNALTERAESVAQRLELMMASLHDVVPQDETAAEVSKEPESAPEAVSARPQPSAEPEGEGEDEPVAEPLAKKPGGLMFLRHNRSEATA
ncbi:hypothetical protein [Ruegeria sp. R14_0]|uniref:hypothetical protein n=1 Tax=Ruegeria sp. R14_0 TaxID=2821100 RepID=UPI001ADAF3C0|nr:hypothetical protein [Ruegeria sp. R14_0]MBO9445845.1 hypothetical protein [Ruegeria sp. R14_0]